MDQDEMIRRDPPDMIENRGIQSICYLHEQWTRESHVGCEYRSTTYGTPC